MVQRRLLTAEFVNGAVPPQKGELWIADTKVRGFGLRLYASNRRGKSYTIRVADEFGTVIRKSYNIYDSWRYRSAAREGRYELEFGDFLEDARSWARREIERLKRLNKTEELDRTDRQEVAGLVRKMTLVRAAESLIDGLKAAGRSQAYGDGLHSVFKYIPSELRRAPLADISPEEMAKALVNDNIDPANIRKLRSLIGSIYKRANVFGAGLWKFEEELSKQTRKRLETQYDPYPELRDLKRQDYEQVLECLENEQNRWQQAMCARLYFELGAPLKKLMQAEWRAVVNNHWYPYLPSEKKYWFESREYLEEKTWTVLIDINERIVADFGESLYLFPSINPSGNGPISTIDPVWRSTLKKCGLAYYPIRHFAMRFGRFRNTPSYYISMLNQYSETWRNMDHAAELSKIVTRRCDSPITSRTYKVELAPLQTKGSAIP